MIPFRARFAAKRLFSRTYYLRLAEILVHPFSFYTILIRKLWPGSSKRPLALRMKDGTIIQVWEFWTLYLFDEVFVERCYEPPQLLEQGPYTTIIDVGANIGLYTLRMKQIWPDAQVLAIEPHPGNFRRLRDHIEANHLARIETVQAGVSEECGCMDLYLSPRNIGGHSMYKKTDIPPISVPVFSLSALLEKHHVEDGGILMKVDCEGCEFALLSTMTQEIAERISCIIFEPERSLYRLDDLLQKLVSLGYRTSTFSELVLAEKTTRLPSGTRSPAR